MCDDDRFGSLEVYALCVMSIGLEVCEFTSLHNLCENDKFGGSEVWKLKIYMLGVMMIILEVWKSTCCV